MNLMHILWSVIVGIITGAVAWLIGAAFVATGIAIVSSIGAFLVATSAIIGLIGGLIYFASGRNIVQG